jgi:predicted XRE-type DNA-binding protein
MTTTQFASVRDAIEDAPETASHMKLRAELMMALERPIKAMGWTQAETAKRLGVTQPRISDLKRGKIDLFAIDSLVAMLTAARLKGEIQVSEAA